MKALKNLLDELETALDRYQYNKYEQLELEEETSQAIFNECQQLLRRMKDEAEELDETIDNYLETMNEPSDYEQYSKEDNRRRIAELIGG